MNMLLGIIIGLVIGVAIGVWLVNAALKELGISDFDDMWKNDERTKGHKRRQEMHRL